MFDIGFAELLMVAIVGLVVLGPEKLPIAARTIGLWVGRIRRSLSSIQTEISEELRLDELKRNVAIEKEELDRELAEMKQPFVESFTGQTSKFEKKVEPPATTEASSAAEGARPSDKPVTGLDVK